MICIGDQKVLLVCGDVHSLIEMYCDTQTTILYPERSLTDIVEDDFPLSKYPKMEMMTMERFTRECVIKRECKECEGILILDECQIDMVERDLILTAFTNGYLGYDKLILMTKFYKKELYNYIKSFIDDVSIVEMKNGNDYEIEYIDCSYDDDSYNDCSYMLWKFDENIHISLNEMCLMVQQILYSNIQKDETVLIYVQSLDIAERLKHNIMKWSSYRVGTIKELKKNNDVIIATNSLERKSIGIKFDYIIDFGMCYSVMMPHTFVVLRYCSQMEMMERCRHLKNKGGKVFRIMSQEFYEKQPYQESVEKDWSHLIMCAYVNKKEDFLIKKLLSIMSICLSNVSMMRGIEMNKHVRDSMKQLKTCGLLNDDGSISFISEKSFHELYLLSQGSPFLIKNYGVILHLEWIMKKRVVPRLILLLTGMSIALMDTIMTFGKNKIFYFTKRDVRRKGYQELYRRWMKMIYNLHPDYILKTQYFFQNDDGFFLIIMEMILTSILTHNDNPFDSFKSFHFDAAFISSFLKRWKWLNCRNVFGISFYNCNDHSFLDSVKNSFQGQFSKKNWKLNHTKYPSFYDIQQKWSGDWYVMTDQVGQEYYKMMWKLMDYSTWKHNLSPHSRRNYYSIKPDESYLILCQEQNLILPIPRDICLYINELEYHIQESFQFFQQLKIQKETHQTNFKKNVVFEIENEVAYRPGNVKFLECQTHFSLLSQYN